VKIQVQPTLTIEVYFDILDREEGYYDDIRVSLYDTAPSGFRMFETDGVGFLLTPDHAEVLAAALLQAARQSRATPSPWENS
jgi:hypothetical protein